jgi:hypothetical protein
VCSELRDVNYEWSAREREGKNEEKNISGSSSNTCKLTYIFLFLSRVYMQTHSEPLTRERKKNIFLILKMKKYVIRPQLHLYIFLSLACRLPLLRLIIIIVVVAARLG